MAVLALLRERPMHPYEIRQLIRARNKEARLVIKPGSLYHAIGWLKANSLIEPIETARHGRRPERTVYRILEAGEKLFFAWLQEMLERPAKEPSSLAVALDHAVHLEPATLVQKLETRIRTLQSRLESMEYSLKTLGPIVGRINLLEIEYERALCHAEFSWLQTIVADLRSGALHWNIREILAFLRSAARQEPSSQTPTT